MFWHVSELWGACRCRIPYAVDRAITHRTAYSRSSARLATVFALLRLPVKLCHRTFESEVSKRAEAFPTPEDDLDKPTVRFNSSQSALEQEVDHKRRVHSQRHERGGFPLVWRQEEQRIGSKTYLQPDTRGWHP